MAPDTSSVGRIDLDLNLNSKKFNKQVDNISKQTKSKFGAMSVAIGNVMANMAQKAVLSVGKFVSDSISKGSELTELENVVDSVFTTMSDQVDDFAKGALDQLGLTEKQAKRMMGTFGAMSKSFGYSESQAFAMSKSLTSLAGDVASFYNLSQDESYNKLKSVFTGEAESLKELGVVMTQTSLDQYAMQKGFGKTTSSMTEQEKVALRLSFVQDKLSVATGDVVKTQDSWANQSRKLMGQIDSFMTAIGQGLINILTPVIKIMNVVMGKLVQLANAFNAFTSSIMGKKASSGSAGAVMKEVADAAETAAGAGGDLSDATQGAADSAKEAKKSLMGFDQLNKLSSDSSSGSGGGSDLNVDDMFSFDDVVADANEGAKELNSRTSELIDLMKKGFAEGIGSDAEKSLARVKQHIDSIKVSASNIFNDSAVQGSIKRWASSIVTHVSKVAGSMVSVGMTISENIIGGADKYLVQNTKFIKDRIVGAFNATADMHDLAGDYAVAVAGIFEVFRGDTAKQITADIITVFSNTLLTAFELVSKIARDIQNAMLRPFIENKDGIKTALENTLAPIQRVTSAISSTVTGVLEHIIDVYDAKISPAFTMIGDGISQILKTIIDVYNQYVAPVFDKVAETLGRVIENDIGPMLKSAIDLLGSVGHAIGVLWKNIIAPFISWLIKTIVPAVAPIIGAIIQLGANLFGAISRIVKGIMDVIGGIIDFLVGVFTGDWELAWDGVKKIFSGIWDMIKGIVRGVIDAILGIIDTGLKLIKGIVDIILKAILGVFELVWNAIKGVVSWVIDGISGIIQTGLDVASKTVSKVLGTIKSVFVNVFNSIWSFMKGIINSIIGGIESMVNSVIKGFNSMIRAINKIKFNVPDWVPIIGGKNFGFNLGEVSGVSLPRLAEGGYLEANKPTLAVVGDNKTQGEIVTPEGKMFEIVMLALTKFADKLESLGYNNRGNNKTDGLGDLVIPIYLDGSMLDEIILSAQQRARLRTGGV